MSEATPGLDAPIHIGFVVRDFLKWSGGVWFIQNLLRGLASLPPQKVQVTVFVPSLVTPRAMLRRFARRLRNAAAKPSHAWMALKSPCTELALWQHGVAELKAVVPEISIYDGSEADLIRQSCEARVDVLIPIMQPMTKDAMPWVGYMPDCQHKYYPQFFSADELASRDRAFERMLQRARVVFTNAKAVIADLERHFPARRAMLFSLPFAPLIRDDELTQAQDDASQARQRIGGEKYFIVCNQFWIHKDHATALRAFARFLGEPRRSGYRLVCTGLTHDYRVPGYFDGLKALVAELGIADYVVFTGFIDRLQQQALVYGALALVQPTLFEGGPGGGAASDAIALGVPCLLSDIPVNRELVNPLAFFFRVGDPESLAEHLERVVADPPVRPTRQMLLDASRQHAQDLGECLLQLAITACRVV